MENKTHYRPPMLLNEDDERPVDANLGSVYALSFCFSLLLFMCIIRVCFARIFWHATLGICFRKPMKRSANRLKRYRASRDTICFEDFQTCMGCVYLCSPVACNFVNETLTFYDAIHRYNENGNQPPSYQQLFKEISENELVSLVLQEINTLNPDLFLKVLPTGSLREGAGKSLPSSSVLGTDYDLMLVPDAVEVGLPARSQDGHFHSFQIVEAQNEPGHVWLKCTTPNLKVWRQLCSERLNADDRSVDLYLSQLAVYNKIKNTFHESSEIAAFVAKYMLARYENDCLRCCCDCCSNKLCPEYDVRELLIERNGPALTTVLKPKYGPEMIHVDFTFAMYCREFPEEYRGFFTSRDANSCTIYHWPERRTIERIKQAGCHVVPKPASKNLVVINREQAENPYLSNSAVLEWRMSFSMAEAILFEELPDIAKESFLAFKAVIKTHVNNIVDINGDFHKLSSYYLKTILLRTVESIEPDYWNPEIVDLEESSRNSEENSLVNEPLTINVDDGVRMSSLRDEINESNESMDAATPLLRNRGNCDSSSTEEMKRKEKDDPVELCRKKRTVSFFHTLFDNLAQCLMERRLNHYWNPDIDLFQQYEELDYASIERCLELIRADFKSHLADEWLEFQRCLSYSCCDFCLPYPRAAQFVSLRKIIKFNCCTVPVSNYDYEKKEPSWRLDPAKIDVY